MDIAEFSIYVALCEPAAVIGELDAFLSRRADIVASHQGVAISFTGDGLLAAFNTSVAIDAYQRQAVEAAFEMLDFAVRSSFRIRIGIASRPLASGSVDSKDWQAFTIYGDTVNRAARLEKCAKERDQKMLVDGATAEAAGNSLRFQRMATIALRGIAEPTSVYAPVPRSDRSS